MFQKIIIKEQKCPNGTAAPRLVALVITSKIVAEVTAMPRQG